MTIVEFLQARISEDEAAATACEPSNWKIIAEGDAPLWVSGLGIHAADSNWDACIDISDALHIVRHDPARVLAECAAKRAIIEAQHWTPQERPTDAQLHFRSSHPAYEYATTEGQRKAWDDADEPPEGEGWERNVDSGRDGWDRFECHEESYWRRLKPEDQRKEWRQYIPRELKALAAIYKDHPDYQEEWSD